MMRASALDNASASCTLRTSRDASALAKNAASYVSFLRAQGGHCSALCVAGGGAPEIADVHARPRHSAAAELDAGQEFVEELPRAAALLPKCARAAYLRPQHAAPLVHLRGRECRGRGEAAAQRALQAVASTRPSSFAAIGLQCHAIFQV